MKELMETEIDFDKIFEVKTKEEVGAILDKFLLGEDGGNDSDGVVVTDKSGGSSVDDAFKDLLAS